MALWSTFNWSDGTFWADGEGVPVPATSFIDKLFYRLSLVVTHTASSSVTTAPTLMLVSAEAGQRAQLDHSHVAFLDLNDNTQHIAVRFNQTSNAVVELTTEAGVIITTEGGVEIVVDSIAPFILDHVHILANQRSRNQPTR